MNRIITLTAILTVSIIILYGYYGGFSTIIFKEKITGGETIVFQNTNGDYPETEKATNEIINYLSKQNKTLPALNISYYAINPHVIEKKNLKSEGGCILPASDTSFISEIKKTYKVRTLENTDYITTEFPLKGKISIFIAQIRIYPRLFRYVNAKNYDYMAPVTEIYDSKRHLITYRMKIAKKNPDNS